MSAETVEARGRPGMIERIRNAIEETFRSPPPLVVLAVPLPAPPTCPDLDFLMSVDQRVLRTVIQGMSGQPGFRHGAEFAEDAPLQGIVKRALSTVGLQQGYAVRDAIARHLADAVRDRLESEASSPSHAVP